MWFFYFFLTFFLICGNIVVTLGDDFMFYFLNRIDDYIRTNGIPFRNIEFDSSYLPTYFNYAILNKIRNSGTITFDMFIPLKYTLAYDEDNCLYLEAIGRDRRTRVVVYSTENYKQTVNSSIIGYKVTDGTLYKEACLIKYNSNMRDVIMKRIKDTYPNKPLFDRIKMFHDLMDDIYKTTYKRVGKDIYDLADYSREMNDATDKIVEYINYLNVCYRDDLMEYDRERMISINYIPSLSDNMSKKNISYYGGMTRERVNEILPVDDRIKILTSFDYKYYCLASAYSSRKTDYYCYLYTGFDDTPVLVMEPCSGINYTKVVYLDKGDYSKYDFSLICRDYLELSNSEALNTNRMIRFNHTNIDDFESNLELVINGTSKDKKKDYDKSKRLAKIKNNL